MYPKEAEGGLEKVGLGNYQDFLSNGGFLPTPTPNFAESITLLLKRLV